MASYKFRILLDNSENEEIFRDIEIDGSNSFEDFYKIIIEAFFFKGDQFASFYVSNESWDKGDEIGLFEMDIENNDSVFHLMSDSIIEDFVASTNQRFILVYDFLKMWCFLIELIQTSEVEKPKPEITLSIGISPTEDSRDIDFGIPTAPQDSEYDLGNDFDDIFSEFDDEEGFEGFENIDDIDI